MDKWICNLTIGTASWSWRRNFFQVGCLFQYTCVQCQTVEKVSRGWEELVVQSAAHLERPSSPVCPFFNFRPFSISPICQTASDQGRDVFAKFPPKESDGILRGERGSQTISVFVFLYLYLFISAYCIFLSLGPDVFAKFPAQEGDGIWRREEARYDFYVSGFIFVFVLYVFVWFYICISLYWPLYFLVFGSRCVC